MTTVTSGLYEQLKDDLGYLKLVRAAELLPSLLDRARTDGLTHAQFLAELLAEEAAATRNRRMAARLRFAHFPARRTLDQFDFDFQPSVDPKLVQDLASLRFVPRGARCCCSASPAAARATVRLGLGDHGACRRASWTVGADPKSHWPRAVRLGVELSSDAVKGLLARRASAIARRSRVDRWQAGVGNPGRPE